MNWLKGVVTEAPSSPVLLAVKLLDRFLRLLLFLVRHRLVIEALQSIERAESGFTVPILRLIRFLGLCCRPADEEEEADAEEQKYHGTEGCVAILLFFIGIGGGGGRRLEHPGNPMLVTALRAVKSVLLKRIQSATAFRAGDSRWH